MRQARLLEPGKIEVIQVPDIDITKDDEVLVQVKAVGICGTDLHTYRGERNDITYPLVMGHELSGIVIKTGKDVTKVAAGDHVVFDPVVSCGHCRTCLSGHDNVCEDVKCFGVQTNGGFQDMIAVRENKVYKIKDSISYECAALGEPFSIAANIVQRGAVEKEDRVVVFGAGTIGIAVLQVLKTIGSAVIVTDISDIKLDIAKDFGADHVINSKKENLEEKIAEIYPGGADVIIDCVGAAPLFTQAQGLTAPCARIVEIGFDNHPSDIPPAVVTKKELTIIGSRMNCHRFNTVVDWLEKDVITDKMISQRYPLEKIGEAFRDTLAHSDTWLKTMIVL